MEDHDVLAIVIIAVAVFLVWGKLSGKVVPPGQVATPAPPATNLVASATSSAGDSFVGQPTIAAGVPEPTTPLTCNTPAVSGLPSIPLHVSLPVDPPPIAIQRNPVSSPVAAHCNVIVASESQKKTVVPLGRPMQRGKLSTL